MKQDLLAGKVYWLCLTSSGKPCRVRLMGTSPSTVSPDGYVRVQYAKNPLDIEWTANENHLFNDRVDAERFNWQELLRVTKDKIKQKQQEIKKLKQYVATYNRLLRATDC